MREKAGEESDGQERQACQTRLRLGGPTPPHLLQRPAVGEVPHMAGLENSPVFLRHICQELALDELDGEPGVVFHQVDVLYRGPQVQA